MFPIVTKPNMPNKVIYYNCYLTRISGEPLLCY